MTWLKTGFAFFCWGSVVVAGAAVALGATPSSVSAVNPSAAALGAHTSESEPAAKGAPVNSAVERGKYLTNAGNCVSCHTRPGLVPFSGGLPFKTPFGTIYSTNITPDNETGIGKWTAADLRRAMQEGIAAGGYPLFPAFPYTSFTKVSDQDVNAIYAYLRTVKAQHYEPPRNGILFSQRWVMKLWNALYFEPARYAPDRSKSAQWNAGAYLVQGLGHCSACHTPRNPMMAEVSSLRFTGGLLLEKVAENKIRLWSGVNLTSASSGLARWSIADLIKYLSTGFSLRAGAFGPMNDVIVNSTAHLAAQDVQAMAVYLKSLPALDALDSTVTSQQAKAGEDIYKQRCEKCHMSSGRGGLFNGPPLAGSAVVQADSPASLINIILYGPEVPKQVSFGAWESMKPYIDVLTDAEIASVSNYVRGSWDNRAAPVTVADVAAQR